MSIPVKGADNSTYQVAQASLGEQAKAASVAVVLASDGNHAKATDIADLGASLGTDGASPPALPGGATGVRGWLRYIAETRLGAVVLAAGSAVIGKVGLQVGGADVAAANPVPVTGAVTLGAYGLGALAAVPGFSANGTALGTPPAGKRGARLYLPQSAAVTYTIAAAQPSAPPGVTFTVSQSVTGPNWDKDLAGTQMIYVTAVTGSPLFRWY